MFAARIDHTPENLTRMITGRNLHPLTIQMDTILTYDNE
jgi:hypothetical protein